MPQVLMLEEDADDRYLTNEVLNELDVEVDIRFFSSGDALFEHLEISPRPSLILLDYNSSPENAPRILKKLKSDPRFVFIPVVVLSDSDLPAYKKECYTNGASSFIKKPHSVEGTKNKIETFFRYWFEVAEV